MSQRSSEREASNDAVNEVCLVGRVAARPESKAMPSGDTLVSFRVIVDRPARSKSAQTVDALECAAWKARVQRTVLRLEKGDVVQVRGAVRRRFFRGPTGAASRVEIEVDHAKIIRRRPAA